MEIPPQGVLSALKRLSSLAITSVLPTPDALLVAPAIMSAAQTPTEATTPNPGIPVGTQPQATSRREGMIVSPALQPIPARRLVRRIRAGKFVEMRDLLSDNVVLHDQLEAIQGPLVNKVTRVHSTFELQRCHR